MVRSPRGAPRQPDFLVGSDQRFRVLVESIKDYAIFTLDLEGRVESWNAGAEIIKGYRRQEIVGRRLDVFYTPEDLAAGLPDRLLDEAVALGRVEDEGWRVRKDGTRFWADVVITALRDPDGTLSGYAKVTRDLTERRNAERDRRRKEEELLRIEQRFRLLVESVEDYAIFMLDAHGCVVSWNSGAERIMGYKVADVTGQHSSRFRLPEEVRAGKCEEELEIAARYGRVEEEGWRVRKDGSTFWASVVLTALHAASGALLGFTEITRDLTDRRQLESERLKSARAEEAVRLRDEFLSIASHELRTPLTTLQIELRALREQRGPCDEKTERRIDRSVRSADRLTALIESLLDVSRIASGKLVLKPEPIDLTRVVAEMVDSLRLSATKAGCELSLTMSDPIHGTWDRLRLEQVLMNLLSNALKYGAGAPVAVTLSTAPDGAVLEVADRGPGIPEEDIGRIFRRFERAAPLRHYGGLGLGLYVTREIVQAHGGTVSARNVPDGGARFTVRLPVAGG